ncbi:MAG: VOC family protein [Brachybacterium alimentarium]|uniref:VOC family protein n=1 Tax=Brachybacterium alimentarium TaxID=47845 RepID=UPI000BB725CF|nr:VOC family protein [Brachybacterium alimentarium]PCC35388.1 VOC family protein [Brachybacterium alimentarium]RCS71070.1 VOC family protein [Brachybacterium alimentarium]RCS74716.1 VOC family protein [Brachybacterium alimentarium]
MPSSTPYISFPRNAAEAMPYYQEIFGGTLDLMTYGDNPMEGMPFTPPPEAVAHAQLQGGLLTLAGGDDIGDSPVPLDGSAYSLMVMPGSVADAEALINQLTSTGARIEMPFAEAPWGDHYGQVKDRFGVLWQIDVPGVQG